LEEVIIDMVRHFKQKTGETNVCLVGGVALNSVLNGRLSRELGFEQTYVPPYPGDDGISVGCCAFGLYGLLQRKIAEESEPGNGNSQRLRRPLWKQPLSPYLGPLYSEYDIQAAIKSAAPWLEVEPMRNEKLRLKTIVEEIASGAVVAWFHGRSEFGPRALGHRSILADPRKKGLVRFINQYVKKRESFRPFAPSVLAEEAKDWFELGTGLNGASNVSPYMSLTASVLPLKRALIPAVTHVDGSSRLQTVTADADPHFYKLISLFRDKTGVPMVLNTSFNTLPGEPIVETPEEAIRSFLCSMGAIEVLVLGDYVIKRKSPNLSKLLGEVTKDGDMKVEPACPKRAGPVTFESTFSLEQGATDDEESVVTTTKVRMPARPMHFEKQGEWFELLDEFEGELLCVCDGTVAFNDMLAQYTATQPEQTRLSPEQLEEETQIIVQNLVHRLVRLFEQTLISW
jgi:carbamoyltransferase